MEIKNHTDERLLIGGHPFPANETVTLDENVFEMILRKACLTADEFFLLLSANGPVQTAVWTEPELRRMEFLQLRQEAAKHGIRGRSKDDLVSSLVGNPKHVEAPDGQS